MNINMSNIESIVLGGGCFWCLEAIFQKEEGVVSVISGYAGGNVDNPKYEDVCSGNTGHAEVVKVGFDTEKVSLKRILGLFFIAHDSTTLNRQGNDIGSQYRSIILYTDEKQKDIVNEYIDSIKGNYKDKIVTEVIPLDTFYEAEEYHKDYYLNNPSNSYCRFVIEPKLKKVSESI